MGAVDQSYALKLRFPYGRSKHDDAWPWRRENVVKRIIYPVKFELQLRC